MIANWGIGAILIGALRRCRIGSIECHSAAIHQSPDECPDWQSSIINGQYSPSFRHHRRHASAVDLAFARA
jgi:hypothetical protein